MTQSESADILRPRPRRSIYELSPQELHELTTAQQEAATIKGSLGIANSALEFTIDRRDDQMVAIVDDFNSAVPGFGIGTRLMGEFRDFCATSGVDQVRGFVLSEAALRTLLTTFGRGVIEYRYHDKPLPMTDEQALQSVQLGEQRRDSSAAEYLATSVDRLVDYGIDTCVYVSRPPEEAGNT